MNRVRSHVIAAGLVVAGLVLGACADDDAGTATTDGALTTASPTTASPTAASPTTGAPTTTAAPTTGPTTTADPVALATAYDEPGPYPVGVTTLQLTKGPKVEVWYPAVEGTTGEVSYDVRDFTPEAIRAILTGDAPATYTFAGARDAEAAAGTFPLVLFSHGFTGIRVQSSFLTSHLASWGFIVAAPDHPSRDLPNVLGNTASGDRADSVDDLLMTHDLLVSENEDAGILGGRIDATTVIAVGHSAGGGTVLAAAGDDRIAGYVSMASGARLGADSTAAVMPDKPSLFLAGTTDAVVPAADVSAPAFAAAPSPSIYWLLEGVGHNGFDDFCTFGNGTGIIGLAEASGLGPLLDAQPQLRTLGEDGCIPPSVPVGDSFPAIRHAVTAWIRWQTGADAEPVGLGGEARDAYPITITVESK
jgi:dienelactone hydrolase